MTQKEPTMTQTPTTSHVRATELAAAENDRKGWNPLRVVGRAFGTVWS